MCENRSCSIRSSFYFHLQTLYRDATLGKISRNISYHNRDSMGIFSLPHQSLNELQFSLRLFCYLSRASSTSICMLMTYGRQMIKITQWTVTYLSPMCASRWRRTLAVLSLKLTISFTLVLMPSIKSCYSLKCCVQPVVYSASREMSGDLI